MRSTLRTMLVLALTLSLALFVAACGSDDNGGGDSGDGGETATKVREGGAMTDAGVLGRLAVRSDEHVARRCFRCDFTRVDHGLEAVRRAMEQPESAAAESRAGGLDHGQCRGHHPVPCFQALPVKTPSDQCPHYQHELLQAGVFQDLVDPEIASHPRNEYGSNEHNA